MRVVVHFTNEERTEATITVVPSWLARLFGARPRVGTASRNGGGWVWSTTGRDVDTDFLARPITSALELGEVTPLPKAAIARHLETGT